MIHVIQNDPEVPPGGIGRILPESVVHHPYRGEPLPGVSGMSGLIVLGGRMGADEDRLHPFLGPLRDLMEKALQCEIPLLGICLGGQLLAMATGGRVVRNRWGERGKVMVSLSAEGSGDPLFHGIESPFQTFQWHDDSFDPPPGSVLLAGSPECPHQAFRIGSGWGLQFHPEITGEILSLWAADEPPAVRRKLETEFETIEDPCSRTLEILLQNFTNVISGRLVLRPCT